MVIRRLGRGVESSFPAMLYDDKYNDDSTPRIAVQVQQVLAKGGFFFY